jgi:two-component system, OmpR family, response regulator
VKLPSNLRILVVEDDPRMVELLSAGLREKGHLVVAAKTAEDGQRLADLEKPDAIVLDIGLPGRSGFSVAAHLRERANRPAIVMLTALNQEDHVVCGLEAGADDYLTKPFSFPELAARIASAVRRTRIAAAGQFYFGPFHLDITRRRLFRERAEIHLSPSEYTLLYTLALHRGETVTRRQLMQAVWGTATIRSGALDTLVNSLRGKMELGQSEMIVTVRGAGYSLADDADVGRRSEA